MVENLIFNPSSSGSSGVSSIASANSSITYSAGTGDVDSAINLSHENIWAVRQEFDNFSTWFRKDADLSLDNAEFLVFGAGVYGSQDIKTIGWDVAAGAFYFADSDGNLENIEAGAITAFGGFVGSGASITALNADNIGSGTVLTDRGGTGVGVWSQGSMFFYTAGSTFSELLKNTSATRYISNTGASNAPAWAQVDLSNGVTGTLALGSIGTFGANRIIYVNGTNTALTSSSTFVFDGTSIGIGTASPSAKIHVISTSNLARFGYDASNYINLDVSSAGVATFEAVGASAQIVFNDDTRVPTLGIGGNSNGYKCRIATTGYGGFVFDQTDGTGNAYFSFQRSAVDRCGFYDDRIVTDDFIIQGNAGIRFQTGGTTDHFRVSSAAGTTFTLYDSSNYLSTVVSSSGAVTFDAVGAGSAFTFSDDVSVPDEAYGAGWDGSLEVPTKNAVYDKIQTLTAGSGITYGQAIATSLAMNLR